MIWIPETLKREPTRQPMQWPESEQGGRGVKMRCETWAQIRDKAMGKSLDFIINVMRSHQKDLH